ncbi:MAG: M20/M25/M40 family metallo-hydrolase [Luteitalea sp.]|nr:M20/M25/M40 family metallo-hydrolase [Luteitalea sp.]
MAMPPSSGPEKGPRSLLPALTVLAVAALTVTLAAQGEERVDYDALYEIKHEAQHNSKVMETLSYLTDVYGPRLTNSPSMRQAAEWAKARLVEWDLSNVHFEPWGPFGRGWTNERFTATLVSPQPFVLDGHPKAWTPGTDGRVTAEVVKTTLDTETDLNEHRGKLKGKIVLLAPRSAQERATGSGNSADADPSFEPLIRRYTDDELRQIQEERIRAETSRRRGGPGSGSQGEEFRRKRMQFLVSEGALATLERSRGEGNGVIGVQGARSGEDMRQPKSPPVLPQVILAVEHYGRLSRILDKQIPVKIDLEIDNRFTDDDLNSFNVVAELPGTDKKDEVVMIGAHFDAWHAATGATDNGASSAVVMEVLRILKSTGLTPRRTIRMGLWTGEEQGLLGSRAYVKQHFANPDTMALEPAHEKLSVYLNMDNGGGAFRGVYLQGNVAAKPIFEAWTAPFEDMGMTTLTMRNTGGTDHLAFDAVGLPGFQFIQDPLDYDTRTHHTNLDFYERVFEEDLIKNAIVLATFAYQAASREALLPRKPLPAPRKEEGRPTPTSTR